LRCERAQSPPLALASAEVHHRTVEPSGRKRDLFYDGLSDRSAPGAAPALMRRGSSTASAENFGFSEVTASRKII
jgi:hypothetical protein